MSLPNSLPNNLPIPVSFGLRSLIPGVVRTLVPIIVALAVRVGLADYTAINEVWLERALTLVVTMLYYVVIRLLEQHWSQIGWLLGYGKAPVYVPGHIVAMTEEKTPEATVTEVFSDPVAHDDGDDDLLIAPERDH